MPITKTMAYKVGEETFSTVEAAKIAAIEDLFDRKSVNIGDNTTQSIGGVILSKADELVEILTCQPESEKPSRKPRSDKGTKRAKAEAINRALQDGKQWAACVFGRSHLREQAADLKRTTKDE